MPGDVGYIDRSISIALNAQQVILAMIAIFFGLVYVEFDQIEADVNNALSHGLISDIERARALSRVFFWSRLMPLLLFNVVTLSIFSPLSIRIVIDTWTRVGPIYFGDYDVGRTTFVFITGLFMYFALWSLTMVWRNRVQAMRF